MLCCHVYSMLDLARPHLLHFTFKQRMQVSIVATLVLVCAVYLPLHLLRLRIVEDAIITYETHSRLFEQGDILLVKKVWFDPARLHRGDVVMWQLKDEYIRDQRHGVFIVSASRVIDRILGVPGDTIEFTEKGILLNGSPLSQDRYPINATQLPIEGSYTVPPGQYFIYPSCLNVRYGGAVREFIGANFKASRSMVSMENILGKVVMLYYPWGRRRSL
jgi:signal peptidase I